MELDHLVVTCANLAEGTAWAVSRLGLPLDPGGRHDHFGTHNLLLSLGPRLYLEVIAPEPGRDRALPNWFGLAGTTTPALRHWVVRVPDHSAALAAAPPEAGEPLRLSRGPYEWTIAVPPDGFLPWGGALPSLIEWHTGDHPADRLPDRGVRLLSLEIGHACAVPLREFLSPLTDPRLRIVPAPGLPWLHARLSTPRGEVAL